MPRTVPEPDVDYLRRIEALARAVVADAHDEPWFAYGEEGQQAAEPWQRAVNELASHVRYVHTEGDGCLDGCVDD